MARREVDVAFLEERRLARDLKTIDFASVHAAAAERSPAAARSRGGPCPVCHGGFGPVLDSVELIRGSAFLTAHAAGEEFLELRQISSTRHGDDLDSVPPMDAIAIFEEMAKAESFLLASGDGRFPESGPEAGPPRRGFVTIDKSRRPRRHGWQAIRLHAREPRRLEHERALIAKHGAGRPSLLETRNPAELLVGEFRGGLAAAVPENPRRAFETIIYCRPSATGGLGDLSGNQRWGLAQALREISGALRLELAVRGLPERYAWRLVAGAGIEPYLQLAAPAELRVDDSPREWVEKLRSHIGVE